MEDAETLRRRFDWTVESSRCKTAFSMADLDCGDIDVLLFLGDRPLAAISKNFPLRREILFEGEELECRRVVSFLMIGDDRARASFFPFKVNLVKLESRALSTSTFEALRVCDFPLPSDDRGERDDVEASPGGNCEDTVSKSALPRRLTDEVGRDRRL